jgi:hypothetical protein
MELLNKTLNMNDFRTRCEVVQKRQIESKILQSFQRTNGLNLYGYDYNKDEVLLIELERKTKDLQLIIVEGKLVPDEKPFEYKTELDNSLIYFEALNLTNANKRVKLFKEGKKELFNLKPISNSTIKLF